MSLYSQIITDLNQYKDPERAKHSLRFFKTGKGQYGEGDIFIGVKTPNLRMLAKKYYEQADFATIQKLLKNPIHSYRSLALMILTNQFVKADKQTQKSIYDFYLDNTKYINNWDLVDLSAYKIVGTYLLDKKAKDRKILYQLARSKDLWEKRISIISTFAFIRTKQFQDTLNISQILLLDDHDLIHKAVGWMLRELGKKNQVVEENFLMEHYKSMPRTMLRYAIEKFDEKKRQFYLKK